MLSEVQSLVLRRISEAKQTIVLQTMSKCWEKSTIMQKLMKEEKKRIQREKRKAKWPKRRREACTRLWGYILKQEAYSGNKKSELNANRSRCTDSLVRRRVSCNKIVLTVRRNFFHAHAKTRHLFGTRMVATESRDVFTKRLMEPDRSCSRRCVDQSSLAAVTICNICTVYTPW